MAKAKVNIPDTNPPMQIIGKNNTLNVINDLQKINIKGKDYKCRLISVSKDLEVLPKWIDKVECFNWIYKFKIFECEFKYILFTLGYEKSDFKNRYEMNNIEKTSCELIIQEIDKKGFFNLKNNNVQIK